MAAHGRRAPAGREGAARGRTYPGAVAEEEDHAGQDVVHPREDVGLGLDRHLAVGQEDGAAGPLPAQVI